jgi:hypothetical protein
MSPAVSALALEDEPEDKCESGELTTRSFNYQADVLPIQGGK